MCPLLEKHVAFIARCNALIEKVSPFIALAEARPTRSAWPDEAQVAVVFQELRSAFTVECDSTVKMLKARCLEALGDSDEGPLVTADVLLPRAVACVAEAKVPHLRAELAYVDAFARDDVLLGAEGYALTTLSCALDVLADGDDSGEQPVLDLGGESWPAPPAPPPASPLGGEDWPEPS